MRTTVRLPNAGDVGTLPPPAAPEAPPGRTFRVVLRPSHWLPVTGITVTGCADADDARAKLHQELDAHILQIEPGR